MPYVVVSYGLLISFLIVRLFMGRMLPIPAAESGIAQTSGRREINADATDWARFGNQYLYLLADGIGSGTKGRTSALAAVDSIARMFELSGSTSNPAYFFRQAFSVANGAVLRYVPDGTAGANVLCAIIKDGHLYYALAGNCRISVFRNGELIPLSEGHTLDILAQKAFRRAQITRADAQLAYHEKRVYNYVGKDDFKELELFDVPVVLKKDDCIVLMTDGVHDFCTDLQMEEILRDSRSVEEGAQKIIRLLEKQDDPAQDNATVMCIKINRL